MSRPLPKINVDLNRLRSQKQRLETRRNHLDNAQRRARTRTLIQLGGLLNMIGLSSYVGINDGDDLQLDLAASDKAATLLGILIEKFQDLPHEPSPQQLQNWQEVGIRSLKIHHAKTLKSIS